MIGLRTVQGSFRVAIDDVKIKQAGDQFRRTKHTISNPQLRLPSSNLLPPESPLGTFRLTRYGRSPDDGSSPESGSR